MAGGGDEEEKDARGWSMVFKVEDHADAKILAEIKKKSQPQPKKVVPVEDLERTVIDRTASGGLLKRLQEAYEASEREDTDDSPELEFSDPTSPSAIADRATSFESSMEE